MKKHLYTPPDNTIWQGRIDQPVGPTTQRWHQKIKMWDLNHSQVVLPQTQTTIALLGFCVDEGVKRNGGRPGAKDGPAAIRKALVNLPVHFPEHVSLLDVGDILCQNGNLEEAQDELGEAVKQLLVAGCLPIVLGGGHEVAYGHYLGQKEKITKHKSLGVFNIDAHFDLRPFENGSHSGSGFLQIATDCKKNDTDFSYFCLGIQKSANSQDLFLKASELNTKFIEAQNLNAENRSANLAEVRRFCDEQQSLYLTICLDAFAANFAPGVSAPSALGILPAEAMYFINAVLKSQKVIGIDIAELNPQHDVANVTSKLAAQLIFQCIDQLT